MAPTVDNTADLTHFKALSFDVYGTLINWKPHILAALDPVLSRLPADHPYARSRQRAYIRFCELTFALEVERPTLTKNRNLAAGLRALAAEVGLNEEEGDGEGEGEGERKVLTEAEVEAMADGPGGWPAFADSVAALQALKKRYKLIVLSNIDNANIERTVTGPLSPSPSPSPSSSSSSGEKKGGGILVRRGVHGPRHRVVQAEPRQLHVPAPAGAGGPGRGRRAGGAAARRARAAGGPHGREADGVPELLDPAGDGPGGGEEEEERRGGPQRRGGGRGGEFPVGV